MIRKAVVTAGGKGTRRMPITYSIEKCMLPILNRPVVDYAVEECVKAGITDIALIVNPQNDQVRSYYSAEHLKEIYPDTELQISFIEQQTKQYGTAVPLAIAADFLAGEEQFALLMGDDFVFNADGSCELQRMMDGIADTGSCGMMAAEVPRERVDMYGVLRLDKKGNYQEIVDKPSIENAPSNLINISKYIFDQDMLQRTVAFIERETDGEYFITDVMNEYVAAGGNMKVHPIHGQYLDAGQTANWVHANTILLEAEQHTT